MDKEILKQLLIDNLTVELKPYTWNDYGFEIVVEFDGEVITKDYYCLKEDL